MLGVKRRLPQRKHIIVLAAVLAVLLLGVVALVIWGGPLFALFSDTDRLHSLVEDAGAWGPLLFIALQILQVFFAPIPGQVTGFAGGYLFGTVLGTAYTLIGAVIGFTLIFILARKLGRPFVEYFVSKKVLDKFDYIANTKGVFVLFLIFLLPAFPDDIICYIAGLTTIRIRILVLIATLGRLPGYLVLSFSGSGVADNNFRTVVIILSVVLVISIMAYWQRDRLERLVQRLARGKGGEN